MLFKLFFSFACLTQVCLASTGSKSSIEASPWVVSLKSIHTEHGCGGAIIEKRWILTGGHCLDWIKKDQPIREQLEAQAGADDLDSLTTLPPIKAIYYAHSYYHHKTIVFDFLFHDAALIELESDIQWSSKIQPISIEGPDLQVGDTLSFSGWGKVSRQSTAAKNEDGIGEHLRSFVEKYSDNATLSALIKPESHLISGILDTEPDTLGIYSFNKACAGDSGNPLIRLPKNPSEKPVLVGIARSAEAYCHADELSATLFTRVSEFKSWIQNTIQ